MFNPLSSFMREHNAYWLRYQSNATAANSTGRVEANNTMNFKAQEEQEKLYAKKNKPLLFDYYKTLYKKD